jgi:predicted DNA-binding transcriptional regulator AlpA
MTTPNIAITDLADDRYLTGPQVRARYSVSDMWLHRRLHDDSGFPKPMVLNRRRYWRLSELVEWERRRVAAQPART